MAANAAHRYLTDDDNRATLTADLEKAIAGYRDTDDYHQNAIAARRPGSDTTVWPETAQMRDARDKVAAAWTDLHNACREYAAACKKGLDRISDGNTDGWQ